MIGRTISHYQILEELGESGLASTRRWWSPDGSEIAPDNARFILLSGCGDPVVDPKPT